MDLQGIHDNDIGCKVDRFSERKLRALNRQGQSEGHQNRPMSEVGAAICGAGYNGAPVDQAQQRAEALRAGRRPGPDSAPTRQAYAAMLQQQVDEKKALQALDAVDRGVRPPKVREDSLDRLMADDRDFRSENAGRKAAGRAPSQGPQAGAPFARQDDHCQVLDPPVRNGNIPWALHNEQYGALPMKGGRGGGVAAARAKGLGGAAPFAMDGDQSDPALHKEGRKPIHPSRGRSAAPFAIGDDREQAPPYALPVPGLPGRHAVQPRAMPPRMPGPSSMIDKPEPKVLSSNMYASGANQNCGNVLTDKPTSRVLRPPGGGGSLQIGSW
eukprot:gnl/MRDRNA2_/MRDRNA2_95870_c0_seq1.p1 gnl/MRDRNA2_/MRDRNA2_95870_c0~~gnl/MRDRNA2_/MRDRNA2_95870_c0_seq1.p1  ORF type:complete len:327 (+),score=78.95 gnl/MRDRNA2_/MRDRNA2_95870_c0_seq1:56-1036(+)